VGLSLEKLAGALANFRFSVPVPAVDHVFSGFEFLSVILVTAIPFGIYDFVEAMDNVESAEAAGDAYPTRTPSRASKSASSTPTDASALFAR
jgi:adenine/guanine/hypoxanthine permease